MSKENLEIQLLLLKYSEKDVKGIIEECFDKNSGNIPIDCKIVSYDVFKDNYAKKHELDPSDEDIDFVLDNKFENDKTVLYWDCEYIIFNRNTKKG